MDRPKNCAVKSDSFIADEVRENLRRIYEALQADRSSDFGGGPRSDNQMRHLVDPSMYLFVYGKSWSSGLC